MSDTDAATLPTEGEACPVQDAFDLDQALMEQLRALRGENRPAAVHSIGKALRSGHRREALTLLGRLEPHFTEVLVDDVVGASLAAAETHRARYLLGRLPHRRARELVAPAAARLLETESDGEAWMRIAELLEHLGLYDELGTLCRQAAENTDSDVREVADYFAAE